MLAARARIRRPEAIGYVQTMCHAPRAVSARGNHDSWSGARRWIGDRPCPRSATGARRARRRDANRRVATALRPTADDAPTPNALRRGASRTNYAAGSPGQVVSATSLAALAHVHLVPDNN